MCLLERWDKDISLKHIPVQCYLQLRKTIKWAAYALGLRENQTNIETDMTK